MRSSPNLRSRGPLALSLPLALVVLIAAPGRADPTLVGLVKVAAPVDVLLGEGLGAGVTTDVRAGAGWEDFGVALQVPVIARVDKPRVDLGNVLLMGEWQSGDLTLGAVGVVPTLWPAADARAQADSLTLAAVGVGGVDGARFVPAATGVGVNGRVRIVPDTTAVTLGGSVGVLGSLAGGAPVVPLSFSVRVGYSEVESPDFGFYLGAHTGGVVDTDALSEGTLSAVGDFGVLFNFDSVLLEAGLSAGVASAANASFAGVVTPHVLLRFAP